MARKRRRGQIRAATLPLLRDDLTRTILKVADADQSDALFKKRLNGVAEAQLWWVTEDMTALVRAVSGDFPIEDGLGSLLLQHAPSMGGILIWDGGLNLEAACADGELSPVIGVWWHLISAQDAEGAAIPIVANPSAALGIDSVLGTEQAGIQEALLKALITTWVLALEPKVASARVETSTLRRAWVPKSDQELPSEITVAALRKIRVDQEGIDEAAHRGSSNYSHRFLVRGHWRKQPCGPARKMRRVTWVVPYVKGPDDKPFIAKDQINVWRR